MFIFCIDLSGDPMAICFHLTHSCSDHEMVFLSMSMTKEYCRFSWDDKTFGSLVCPMIKCPLVGPETLILVWWLKYIRDLCAARENSVFHCRALSWKIHFFIFVHPILTGTQNLHYILICIDTKGSNQFLRTRISWWRFSRMHPPNFPILG